MFSTYLKATVAAAIAGLGSVSVALVDNSIVAGEWVGAAIVTLTVFSGVWAAPNKP